MAAGTEDATGSGWRRERRQPALRESSRVEVHFTGERLQSPARVRNPLAVSARPEHSCVSRAGKVSAPDEDHDHDDDEKTHEASVE